MASLVEPNIELFEFFRGFPEWGKFIERIPLSTVRLDEVEEIQNIDLLKIDTEGHELEVLSGAKNLLKKLKLAKYQAYIIKTNKDPAPIPEIVNGK